MGGLRGEERGGSQRGWPAPPGADLAGTRGSREGPGAESRGRPQQGRVGAEGVLDGERLGSAREPSLGRKRSEDPRSPWKVGCAGWRSGGSQECNRAGAGISDNGATSRWARGSHRGAQAALLTCYGFESAFCHMTVGWPAQASEQENTALPVLSASCLSGFQICSQVSIRTAPCPRPQAP